MNAESRILSNKALLALIGRRIPAIYDLIPRHRIRDRMGEPHPIPWLVAGMAIGRLALQSAHAAQRGGGKAGVAMDYLDDWCPVGKPFPFPIRFPLDDILGDDPPRPEEADMRDLHRGVALGLAAASLGIKDQALQEVIDQGIQRSIGVLAKPIG